LKSLVSILFKNSGKFDIAEQILNELINYCSENKMATGALLSWYLISTLETIKSNTDNALSIAEKALDVANNANINNHYFKVLLYKQIAEIYTLKGDFKTAVMYIQKAVELTSKNGLKLLESELFLSYGKVFQEAATASDENKVQNLETAHRSYMKALNIAQELENEALIEQIEKELVSLATFCQLSGIKL
jgi:tetratricopeptide (TPR) repeat protein